MGRAFTEPPAGFFSGTHGLTPEAGSE